MAKKTKNFSLSGIQDFIGDLDDARDIVNAEDRKAEVAALAVGIMLGFAAHPAIGALVAIGLFATSDWDNLSDLCDDAIYEFENYEDFLQNNPLTYDLIRVEMTYKSITYEGITYNLPTDLRVVAVHQINPNGWITL
ncbi:hypothetical protein HZF24_16095 [Sedimentibacter hydroxybenzoicus DSM 7310]|uniref:Uncharacterized protein n=1 Tax=Sedimentibacter hydroxybenzoicus DSM 7310 TaxID=1123245 RepID=A0A974GY22_SEDHY|nr:hypothetical protein [Sedimentibacter hydroxybenzoicus]NYB75670.1 hypothetical protein [Sedimentibacter hydroxybenzoicus DSM 7310]